MPSKTENLLDEADYSNVRFDDERVIIATKGQVRLGRGFIAKDCEVVLESGTEIIAAGAQFINCKISNKSTRYGHTGYASFASCTFLGSYKSWKFGGRTGEVPLTSCDFHEATLDDVTFFDTDMRAQRFRGWPTIVFLDPEIHKDGIKRLPWPAGVKAQIWLQTLWMQRCAGVAVDAAAVAKEIGIKSDKLRKIVEELDEEAVIV